MHGPVVACNQKNPTLHKDIRFFYSRCLVKNKVCNLIIDNGSYENIVSTALVDYLKLEMGSTLTHTPLGGSKMALASR